MSSQVSRFPILTFRVDDGGDDSEKTYKFSIEDESRMTYYTKMYIGSNKQEVRMAFDTMTPISLVNAQNCVGCNDMTEGYEYQNSNSIRRITDEKISF